MRHRLRLLACSPLSAPVRLITARAPFARRLHACVPLAQRIMRLCDSSPLRRLCRPFWEMPHALVSVALGLLLVHRMTQAYERFWTGRKSWQRLTDLCRNGGRRAVTWCRPPCGGDEAAEAAARSAGHDIAAHHLAFVAATEARLRCSTRMTFHASLSSLVPHQMLELLDSATHAPLACANEIGRLIQAAQTAGYMSEPHALHMEDALEQMLLVAGECDCIARTPTPFEYSTHTSRFLTLFCFTLPLVLAPLMGWVTVPAATLVAYSLLAIDESACPALGVGCVRIAATDDVFLCSFCGCGGAFQWLPAPQLALRPAAPGHAAVRGRACRHAQKLAPLLSAPSVGRSSLCVRDVYRIAASHPSPPVLKPCVPAASLHDCVSAFALRCMVALRHAARRCVSAAAGAPTWLSPPAALEGRSVLRLEGADVFTYLQARPFRS